ncbi:MAG: DUF6345 domain-containing protein [Planctomycetota bacterium]
MKINRKLTAGLILAAALTTTTPTFAQEEGGYAGTNNQGHTTVVYNFLKHFSYDQYYYSAYHQWTYNNNARVDNMDIAIFAGHGSPWYFVGEDGYGVNLRTAGSSSNLGYGNWDCEFVAFQSCAVVPSPLEYSNWYSNWTQTNGVFDGLHQAIGFRNSSYQSTDQDVTDTFGTYITWNIGVWESWFYAINAEAYWYEDGSAVMYPLCDGDTYYSFAADPPASSTWLKVWYQH